MLTSALAAICFNTKKQVATGLTVGQSLKTTTNKILISVFALTVVGFVASAAVFGLHGNAIAQNEVKAETSTALQATEVVGEVDSWTGAVTYKPGQFVNNTANDYKFSVSSLVKSAGADDGGCTWVVSSGTTTLFNGTAGSTGTTGATVTVPANSSVEYLISSPNLTADIAKGLTGNASVLAIKVSTEQAEPVKTQCTVTYNMFGYTGDQKPADQKVDPGSLATKPTDPAATGYTFAGWYSDEACTTLFDFTKDTITKDTTLYGTLDKSVPLYVLGGSGSPEPSGENISYYPGMTWAEWNSNTKYRISSFSFEMASMTFSFENTGIKTFTKEVDDFGEETTFKNLSSPATNVSLFSSIYNLYLGSGYFIPCVANAETYTTSYPATDTKLENSLSTGTKYDEETGEPISFDLIFFNLVKE